MIVQKYNSEEEWLDARRGRITGTRAGNLMLKNGKGYKQGFYELIAERVAVPHDGENVMDRGKRLEDEAIERFTKDTGKKVNTDLVIWSREDNPDIAISPDGQIGKTEAVEVKCLSSARHIEALLTKEVPSDYRDQAIQYFVVNDKLKKLYFVFYDPRMPVDLFFIEMKREDVQIEVEASLKMQLDVLRAVANIQTELTF